MSLKSKLQEWIIRDKYVLHRDIKFACENQHFGRYYKIGTAERRLRSSDSPMIEPDIVNGSIKGYKLSEDYQEMQKLEKEGFLDGQVGKQSNPSVCKTDSSASEVQILPLSTIKEMKCMTMF